MRALALIADRKLELTDRPVIAAGGIATGRGLAAVLAASSAAAQQPLKIGVILPYSGQFADGATQLDNGIKLYVQQHGDAIVGRKIEIIRRDTGGVAPDVAKRLAQELVVRDNVDLLAGFLLTPITSASATTGSDLVIPAFAALAIGGFGSFRGAIGGSIVVGLVEASTALILPPSLKSVGIYAVYLLVVFIRPRGLFGSL